MHCNIFDIFYSQFSQKHVSVAIVAIFKMTLLQECKCTMWLTMSTSLRDNQKLL